MVFPQPAEEPFANSLPAVRLRSSSPAKSRRDVTASSIRKLYELLSGELISDARIEDIQALAGDLPVPATSIFTKSDGIVHWRTCLLQENARAENIELVLASHAGLGVNAAALWVVADRLAQPEGTFRPFNRLGPFILAYGRRENGRN